MAKPPTTKTVDWKAAHAAGKFKWCSWDESEDKGITPNRTGWIIDQPENGGLVIFQSGTDWALGENGLNYLNKAKQEGRIEKSFVVLMDKQKKIAGVAPLEDVMKLVSGVKPEPGKFENWGPFWWITADFRLAPTSSSSSSSSPSPF
jgi:hypothetical protein